MKVEKIQSIVTPKTTGYCAAGSLGFAVLSGVSKNKTFKKLHKPFALVSTFFTLLHIGLIEYYHHKFKNK